MSAVNELSDNPKKYMAEKFDSYKEDENQDFYF
jgi:hypothetical protein